MTICYSVNIHVNEWKFTYTYILFCGHEDSFVWMKSDSMFRVGLRSWIKLSFLP